jgi:hypothetical protein
VRIRSVPRFIRESLRWNAGTRINVPLFSQRSRVC